MASVHLMFTSVSIATFICKIPVVIVLLLLYQSREHEWFKQSLPSYLFPTGTDVDASIIDTEVIQEVCEVGIIITTCTNVVRRKRYS